MAGRWIDVTRADDPPDRQRLLNKTSGEERWVDRDEFNRISPPAAEDLAERAWIAGSQAYFATGPDLERPARAIAAIRRVLAEHQAKRTPWSDYMASEAGQAELAIEERNARLEELLAAALRAQGWLEDIIRCASLPDLDLLDKDAAVLRAAIAKCKAAKQ